MKPNHGRVAVFFLLAALAGLLACRSQEPVQTSLVDDLAVTTTVTLPPPTATGESALSPTPAIPAHIALPDDLASPTPMLLPTVSSTPTASATPAIPHLYVQGEHISLAGWSPDSRWLAYWLSAEEDMVDLEPYTTPGGTLHVLNSASGESCALAQFHRSSQEQMRVVWTADSSLVVQDWEAAAQWQGQPCRPGSFVRLAPAPAPPEIVAEERGISPDGRFQAATELQAEGEDNWRTVQTILRDAAGMEITAVAWRTQASVDSLGAGGEWISPTQFYIRWTGEGRSLLLDASQPGAVIDIQQDIFALPARQEAFDRATVAIPGAAPDSFALLLLSDRWGSSPIAVYHASSELVEELPYSRSAWRPFSPDHEWLLMYATENNNLWLRQLADVDGEWRLLGEGVGNNLVWNQAVTEIALNQELDQVSQVTWQTFPEGELIGQWVTEPFGSQAVDWSPNDRFLVVLGFEKTGEARYKQALFLFERNAG